MFKVFILIAIYIAACYGAPGTSCGESPSNLFICSAVPVLMGEEAYRRCEDISDECYRINCMYHESTLMEDEVLDKVKFALVLSEFVKNYTEWTPAVENAKRECLGEPLKPQGVNLDCPAYDITYCVYVSFIRLSAEINWSSAESCANAREYARSCPVCPTECSSPDIPTGSCNACSTRPTN